MEFFNYFRRTRHFILRDSSVEMVALVRDEGQRVSVQVYGALDEQRLPTDNELYSSSDSDGNLMNMDDRK